MMQIENTFFALADGTKEDCLVICDRGAMDPSACKEKNHNFVITYHSFCAQLIVFCFVLDLPVEDWVRMCKLNQWNEVDLRDNRYNQVITEPRSQKSGRSH